METAIYRGSNPDRHGEVPRRFGLFSIAQKSVAQTDQSASLPDTGHCGEALKQSLRRRTVISALASAIILHPQV